MKFQTLWDRTKQRVRRAWARLMAAFGFGAKLPGNGTPFDATPDSSASPAPPPSIEALPALAENTQIEVSEQEQDTGAAAPEARIAPVPARWLTGVAKSEAGRMMPWVFVPPERKYRLYLPASAPHTHPRALVVMIHGCRQDAVSFANGTRFNALADQHHFAVLYPDQLDLANPQRCWNWFEARTLSGQGEAAILESMIDAAVRRARVDSQCVVIAGMSSGAALAALLAFQRPESFAGVVVHSGLPPHAAHSVGGALEAMRHGCKLDVAALTQRYWSKHQLPPPPLRILHGDADAVVHPLNAERLFDLWASLHQAETPVALVRHERAVTPSNSRSYQVTTLSAEKTPIAEKIIVHGLDHAWSGGDAALPFNDASEPSASAMIAQWVQQVVTSKQ